MLACAVSSAGPVGLYLGFEVRRQAMGSETGQDSIHYIYPSPSDTILYHHNIDTTTILAETLRQGCPAWISRHAVWPATDAATIDTSFESGDTLLYARSQLGDSVRWLAAYRVPFNIGDQWLFGLDGTYIYDFNGDTVPDTLSVWADTCRVADTEDVVVPYGLVPRCYRLERTMWQRLAAMYQGVPAIETSYIRTTEWYKDSLWSVKESVCASGPIYAKVFVWIHIADFVSVYVSQLGELGWLHVAEPEGPQAASPSLQACPNPTRGRTEVRLSPGACPRSPQTLRVYDAGGRLVLSQPVRASTLILPASSLPPGAYILKVGSMVSPLTVLR
jgi:hypothetical protein